jgi:hypothetical protein
MFANLRGRQNQQKNYSNYETFQIYIVNFLQLNIISSYNIEGFKQVSNSTTCL